MRAAAHHLAAAVHVGQQGVTAALRASLDDSLRTRELVKIQFTKGAPVDVRAAANALAGELSADVVQVIGRTATLHRKRPDAAS